MSISSQQKPGKGKPHLLNLLQNHEQPEKATYDNADSTENNQNNTRAE